MSRDTEVIPLERRYDARFALAREYALTLAVALVVFLIAYDNGGYSESTRDSLAIGVWWAVVLGVAFALVPRMRIPVAAYVTGGFLLALVLLTLLSTSWAADAAGAYAEFTRAALYLGVFVLAVLGSTRGNAGRWADGVALGLVAITVVAIVSRCFPGTFPYRELPRLLPSGANRLAFPLGYWNGLAILVALAIPLLLRVAVRSPNLFVRGAALAPIPAIACVIYLASSRTGVATAVVGALAFLLLTARRWAATAALLVAIAGSLPAIFMLLGRDALVDGPVTSAAAASEGKSAALILLGICILAGLLYGVGGKALEQTGTPEPSRAFGWILLAVATVGAVAAVVSVHPVRRFEAFKHPELQGGDIQSHLLSSAGNGRWQLWTEAVREFETKPLLGRGAGSYGSWWLQHASLPMFVQDAHSLYAETLGELGIVGLLLLAGVFLTGLGAAVRRLLRAERDERVTIAALTATFVAFAVAAAADWMWELTIVPVVAFVCLGLAVGPASVAVPQPRVPTSGLRRYAAGAGVAVAGLLVICAIAVELLAGAKIQDSRDAAARGDLAAAASAAQDARSIQSWSAEPYLQLALVEEQAGNYGAARRLIVKAIARDRVDWQLWYTRARIETESGQVKAGARSFRRACRLNPKSPLCKNQ